MSEETTTDIVSEETVEARTPEARTPEDKPIKPTETVEFWKAMSRKNEKAAKELEELRAAQLSKEELAAKEAADAKAEAAQAKAEALRWRIAAKHGITDEDAELFLTATDEDTLTRQAERLKDRTPQIPPKGNVIPSVGKQPAQPPSLADQIAAAESSGDYNTSLALKAQQIADLARNTR